MELLQLATLLIRRAPQQLVQHRKELIKFGWNHLKRDDSAAKYYAFLNVCHFLDAYQAPEKIVLQVRSVIPSSRKPYLQALLPGPDMLIVEVSTVCLCTKDAEDTGKPPKISKPQFD